MKKETIKNIRESLQRLEETWDEHLKQKAIRRAYLFRNPEKKKIYS